MKGFTLIESILILAIVGASFLGLGLVLATADRAALSSDMTVVAVALSREKLEELIAIKAAQGYRAIASSPPARLQHGSWEFTQEVAVQFVDPVSFSPNAVDRGYKNVLVRTSWGSGVGHAVALQTLLTDQVPAQIVGRGYPPCP